VLAAPSRRIEALEIKRFGSAKSGNTRASIEVLDIDAFGSAKYGDMSVDVRAERTR
jgi:hypothetical protein